MSRIILTPLAALILSALLPLATGSAQPSPSPIDDSEDGSTEDITPSEDEATPEWSDDDYAAQPQPSPDDAASTADAGFDAGPESVEAATRSAQPNNGPLSPTADDSEAADSSTPSPMPAAGNAPYSSPAPAAANRGLPSPTTTRSYPLALAAPSPWNPGRSSMDDALSLLGLLSFRYPGSGVGLGFYYQKIIVPQGVIRDASALHDELGIEGGFAVRRHSWTANLSNTDQTRWSYTDLTLSVTGLWNVWINPNIAVYPKLGFGYGFGAAPDDGAYHKSTFGGVAGILALGAVYRIGPIYVRGEIRGESSRLGLALGATYTLP